MKVLAIDMGTGTQDILLFDSAGRRKQHQDGDAERDADRRRRASGAPPQRRRPLLLTGVDPGRRAVPLGARRPPPRRRRRVRHARSGADLRRRPRAGGAHGHPRRQRGRGGARSTASTASNCRTSICRRFAPRSRRSMSRPNSTAWRSAVSTMAPRRPATPTASSASTTSSASSSERNDLTAFADAAGRAAGRT